MIKSLVLDNKYSIDVDKSNRIEVEGKKLSVKDIPYVRYEFGGYDESAVEYIKKSIEKFPFSVHVVDIVLEDGCIDTIERLNTTFNSGDYINIAIFVIVNVKGEDAVNFTVGEHNKQLLSSTLVSTSAGVTIDRYVIKDIDKCINNRQISDSIIGEVRNIAGCDEDSIALCSSILSGSKEYMKGCLKASVVRSLQEFKSYYMEVPLVPEGHQVGCASCGCTKYYKVQSDIKVTMSESVSRGTSGSSAKDKKEKSSGGKKQVKKQARLVLNDNF